MYKRQIGHRVSLTIGQRVWSTSLTIGQRVSLTIGQRMWSASLTIGQRVSLTIGQRVWSASLTVGQRVSLTIGQRVWSTSLTIGQRVSLTIGHRVSLTIGQRVWSTPLTIGQRVPVGGADLNDRSSGRKILIEDGPIVFSELWIIVIHVDQVNNQRTCTCPCRLTCPTVYSMTLASSVSNGEVANPGAVRWVQTIPPQFLQDFVPQTFYRGLARGPTGRLLSPQPLTNPFPHPGSAPVVY